MAITPRPKRGASKQSPPDEREIATFIAGRESGPEPSSDAKRARVMMRFDPSLLERIDAAAKRRGVSRTAWLHMVASRALDQGDG